MKLKLPKHRPTGLKIYCPKCKHDNPKCRNHHDVHIYRARVHVPGSKKSVRTREFGRDYDEAEQGAVAFKNELKANGYAPARGVQSVPEETISKDLSIPAVIIMFLRHLQGNNPLLQRQIKPVSKYYRDSHERAIRYLCEIVNRSGDVTRMRMDDVTDKHVSDLYQYLANQYGPRYFNHSMYALRRLFTFAVEEQYATKNPFANFVRKPAPKKAPEALTKEEYESIVAVLRNDAHNSGSQFYRPYLEDGYALALLTGLRREELIELRWSDLKTYSGTMFFVVRNIKVERITKRESPPKYIPVNADLLSLMHRLGFEAHAGTDRYVLYPERKEALSTMIHNLSLSFTHYRTKAGIQKEVSLKHLRKTYLTWTNAVMEKDTGTLSSHSTHTMLENHYLDPRVLGAVEKAALNVKVFGE